MLNFAEKIIVKGVLRRLLKKLPKLKDKAFWLVEEHGDDLVEKVFEAINQIVLDFAEKLKDK
jgi:hypothetical protein